MYTMTPEPIPTAYFLNRSLQSVWICIPFIYSRQRLSRHVPVVTNTRKNLRIVGREVFYTCHIEGESVCLLVFPSYRF
jgi:hypothetical protein